MADAYKFQVNLRGVIDLLSDHLYTGPQVYLRELLQNACDAITARRRQEPDWEGRIQLEVIAATDQRGAVLVVTDNGVGLSEEETHQFLATIGESSKRGAANRDDFLGQFGIGLLSAFVVSDEVVVLTRSVRPGSPTLEWRGHADGSYALRQLKIDMEPGAQVHLRAKPGREEHFTWERVRETAAHFGQFLPIPVEVIGRQGRAAINATPPWTLARQNLAACREELLEYASREFEQEFMDVIPLRSAAGGVEGAAFVLAEAAPLAGKRAHRVYLKNMLLSEAADGLLPEWAFFVKCVVNATKLRPTASRETFYDDARLARARDELGDCLKAYVMRLARHDRDRLSALISRHYLAMKSLAVEDDDFFRLIIDQLPFESTLGVTTLGEHCAGSAAIRYVPSVDQFRQIAGVAAAQGMIVFNTGYTFDTELLQKVAAEFPDRQVEQVDGRDFAQRFGDLDPRERAAAAPLIELAERVLRPFRCAVDVRKFAPATLPTLYTINEAATFLRSLEDAQEETDELWSGVLDSLAHQPAADARACLCLNFHHPLIRRLAAVKQPDLVRRAVEMLYVQALLLGHYPLQPKETALLGDGLLGLIELGLQRQEPGPAPPGPPAGETDG